MLSRLSCLDDEGIYRYDFTNSEQSVELEMREEVAAAHHSDSLEKIARHHSIPVMDHEVSRFLAQIPEWGRIVDVGGCWGWHWRKLGVLRPDVQIVIVDFVRTNLLHARDLLGDAVNKSIFLVHGDAMDLRFPDGAFDGYWTVQTLQHIPSFDKAVAEAFRVLRTGGVFANYSLNDQPPIRWLYRLLGRSYVTEEWVAGAYWLARATPGQKRLIESVFGTTVSERWSEILYSPELHFPVPGRETSLLGKFDALLSNDAGFLGWFARQRSFLCKKP
jgi:ubiquinone/menaquinone biosynthesis C-methylase UbiE